MMDIVKISLMGLYCSWGFVASLALCNLLEEKYKRDIIGHEFFLYIILSVVIYVVIGGVMAFKMFK